MQQPPQDPDSTYWKLCFLFLVVECFPPSSPSPEFESCPWSLQQWQLKCNEWILIQGALQWHRKTFRGTLILCLNWLCFHRYWGMLFAWGRNCCCESSILWTSVFWCSVQITPSTQTRMHPERKSLREWSQAALLYHFYIAIWKNHFSAAGTLPLKEVKVIIYLAPAGQGLLHSCTHSLIVFQHWSAPSSQTLSLGFNTAYEKWQLLQENRVNVLICMPS